MPSCLFSVALVAKNAINCRDLHLYFQKISGGDTHDSKALDNECGRVRYIYDVNVIQVKRAARQHPVAKQRKQIG